MSRDPFLCLAVRSRHLEEWRHRRTRSQLQILADAIDLYSRMAVALEDPTEILELFEELLDFAARTPELSAKVSSKLADSFEGLA